eukprot:TRINITY_DN28_c0_g1_i1.p1 TRINITY_DN28_c0_g1~~TRINITY_DN28_c0_g1_i1.p1  ORF type:complete len:441 (-),score=123.01 TRINITY_DN28_c0_g1_i1:35-1357(-)
MSKFINKISKETKSLGHSISAKTHQTFGNGTVDKDFETKRGEITKIEKRLRKLQVHLKAYNEAIQNAHKAQDKITKTMTKLMGSDTSLTIGNANSFTNELTQHSKILETSLKTETVSFIDMYLTQFDELTKRINERYNRLGHMDKAEKDLKGVQKSGTPGARTGDYEHNSAQFRENYNRLNDELKADFDRIITDMNMFIPLVYPAIATNQSVWFNATQAASARYLTPIANQVDIQRIRTYPQVITPSSNSAMYIKAAPVATITPVEPVPSYADTSYEAPPPTQYPPTQYPQQPIPVPQPYASAPVPVGRPQPMPRPSAPPSDHQSHLAPPMTRPRQNSAPAHPNIPSQTVPRGVPPPSQVPNPNANAPQRPLPVPKVLPIPPTPKKPMATALYEFNATEPSELSFKVGDTITIVETAGQWWVAELNGKRGQVPSNYFQKL